MFAATAVAAVVLTGCGGGSGASSTSSKDPKAALSTGLAGLGDKDALTVTLKLDTTPEKLIGFSQESGKASDKLTPQQAQELASGSFVIETKTTDGSALSDAKSGKAAVRFAFTDNGQTLAQVEDISNVLYAQADVKTMVSTFGKAKQYDDLATRVKSLPPFVQAFVRGGWVSLDLNALKALAGQFGANASPNSQQSQKLLNDIKAALTRDVTVTRVGTDSQGDHLRLTTQTRQFAQDLVQTVTSDIPAAGIAANQFKPQDVPDHSVVLDAWVSDGALAKLSLDVVQFAKPGETKAGDSLPVVLLFDRSGDDISKPADATPIQTQQLFSMLGALTGK
jgi:hypothetical protein